MASKRQMTRAKMDREQAVREKRARKKQKREDKKHTAIGSAVGTEDALSEQDAGGAAPNE
jgi:hypothetical protein